MEEDLIKRLKRRDMNAYEEVVDRYKSYVGAIVKSRIKSIMNQEDIEEVVADVFFALWKQCDKLDTKKGTIKNYLGMIARNMAVNKLRGRNNTISLDEVPYLQSDDSPELEVLDKEIMDVIIFELDELESPDKEIFRKYHLEEKTIDEIAKELNINPNTVKTKLARTRKKLKKKLSERGYCYERRFKEADQT